MLVRCFTFQIYTMNILVINAGSSSLKYQLLNIMNNTIIAKGMVDRIGIL